MALQWQTAGWPGGSGLWYYAQNGRLQYRVTDAETEWVLECMLFAPEGTPINSPGGHMVLLGRWLCGKSADLGEAEQLQAMQNYVVQCANSMLTGLCSGVDIP